MTNLYYLIIGINSNSNDSRNKHKNKFCPLNTSDSIGFDKVQNLHYFFVANLPKEHDELFLALMHNRLINVVSTSVVTTSRT